MYKNQLQELAQRSCFNLPSYTCIREGPDHAPRFKASVNFNGEIFESPTYCSTLRQAEHAAAEVSLSVLSSRVPSRALTAKILDETGIYKNLLQETAHRAGLDLPMYTSVRSGSCHFPGFSCTVELAGMRFTGESAKTKKQAEKNAAIAAWSSLKKMSRLESQDEEKEQEAVARVLSRFKPKEVRRRETTNQWRRRTSHQDTTNKDLLTERLRWINLLTNQASSSPSSSATQNQHKKPSFISLVPPPTQPKSSKILPFRTNLQEAKPETETMITNSFPLPMADHKAKLNESSNSFSKQSPFSDKGRYNFVGGCNLNSNRFAPVVHMRSVIPVFAAPPSKPNFKPNPSSLSSSVNESTTSISHCSVTSTPGLGGQEKKKSSRRERIKLGLESRVLDQTHD
ncbi:PREDICTED: LOW QUALITY PROTEIN: double-stranded RNA-binding protein 5-like [Camelina sativa]|uniref:LOW QUALITY PROTEIN: double-stranded RNA-binding protein 5-like n=1 Tax=Camelina sativa TaxID=90675 RepID=A0ABM0UHL4_CAMSA|nr:PREDICTED: LOW QUALITY PROTEIN: double-stranded RNA-binding protein 5-like [Camelina sativa]